MSFNSALLDYLDGEDSPLLTKIPSITNEELTEGVTGGAGTFDTLMASVRSHLAREFDKGRISGAEYTKAYIALTEASLGNSVQFLLQRDSAHWQAINAQIDAITARANLDLVAAQVELTGAEIILKHKQIELMSQEILNKQQEGKLIQEQVEVQRAQTLNQRTDGATVVGAIGKQKDLLTQQIESYQKDAEVKAGKLWIDSWITQKTIDEGLTPPTAIANNAVNSVMNTIKASNNL